MPEPARPLDWAEWDSFDDLFNLVDWYDEDMISEDMKTDAGLLPLQEASRRLGLSQKSILRKIKKRQLEARIINGQVHVRVPEEEPEQEDETLPDNNESIDEVPPEQQTPELDKMPFLVEEIEAATSEDITEQVDSKEPESVLQLLELIDKLSRDLSSASLRVGYLESQLASQSEQIKLLPDYEARKKMAEQERFLLSTENKKLRLKDKFQKTRIYAQTQEIEDLRDKLTEVEKLAGRSIWARFCDWLEP